MKTKIETIVWDEECEKVVLGTIIGQAGVLDEVRELMDVDCFYKQLHRDIWEAIVSVSDKGDSPNIISVSAELRSKGSGITPLELIEATKGFATDSLSQYVLHLVDLSTRRKLWMIGQRLVKAGVSEAESLDELRVHAKDEIENLFAVQDKNIFTLDDVFVDLYDLIGKNQGGVGLTGTPTGFHKLDERGGLQGGNLVIVAGETSMGKTSFAMAVVTNALSHGAKIAFYSMEMTSVELSARMVAMRSGISANEILYSSTLTNEQLSCIDRAMGSLSHSNLYFDDRSTSNIDTIISSIRGMKIKHDIVGAVVDYLQILNVNMKNTNKEQAMGDVARRLKNLAKELNIWIIALSQLNRDSQNPEPNLNRLRDSGQIAEASDIVMFVYRPEYYHRKFSEPFENADVKGKALINVAKGRNIGTTKFLCKFDKSTTLFTDLKESDYGSIGATNQIEQETPF